MGKIKMRLINLLLLFLLVGVASGKETFLEETSARVHEMWEVWMEMPPLKNDRISEDDLTKFLGEWYGSGTSEGEEEELSIFIRFYEDGRWYAESAMPEMPDARWYIHNDMVLLFNQPIDSRDQSFHFFTAAVMKGGRFFLIIADDDSGLIELKRTEPDEGDESE